MRLAAAPGWLGVDRPSARDLAPTQPTTPRNRVRGIYMQRSGRGRVGAITAGGRAAAFFRSLDVVGVAVLQARHNGNGGGGSGSRSIGIRISNRSVRAAGVRWSRLDTPPAYPSHTHTYNCPPPMPPPGRRVLASPDGSVCPRSKLRAAALSPAHKRPNQSGRWCNGGPGKPRKRRTVGGQRGAG